MSPVLGKDIKLPHQGLARYRVGESHVVIIDLDEERIVVEVSMQFRPELGGFDCPTLTLRAGNLLFFYFLKTHGVVELLNSWNLETI